MDNAKNRAVPPFLLQPVLKDYVWGGERLKAGYGKQISLPIVAESWECSVHPDGESVIASGAHAGSTLAAVLDRHPELLGYGRKQNREFSLLVKLIDAREMLSVQVHPDDAYAQGNEDGPGKTEAWVILECEPESFVYHSFHSPVTKEEIRHSLAAGSLTDLLRRIPVHRHDVIYIPAGVPHAVGSGILLAEVSQNSNSTYRLYDHGRMPVDGKKRPLHVDRALDVSVLTPVDTKPSGCGMISKSSCHMLRQLVKCMHFTMQMLTLHGSYPLPVNMLALVALCTDGMVTLEDGCGSLPLGKGGCAFIPANQDSLCLQGTGRVLLISE